ncbi:MAG: NADP-dependent malic enzyme [Clostridia bacterium]|nr:NADP-dependent malic enzyme [Clostridia bacterium]
MDVYKKALDAHQKWGGKWQVTSKTKVDNKDDLAIAYTPGVAQPCLEIKKDKQNAYKYTLKNNLVAVVSDGSAVLGLGNIGGLAGLPVMEGKCILFKEFGGVDAIPLVLDTQNSDEIVDTIKNVAISFGGINLEDISAPRCFEIEQKLKQILDIPVFHDDQHGTAIVVLAGVINSLKLVGKKIDQAKFVVNGMGAAGTSIAKLLLEYGVKHMTCCDKDGILNDDNATLCHHKELVSLTGSHNKKGTLSDALAGADVFVGVSVANCVTPDMVSSMAKDAVIFAMANPSPEILPDIAKQAGAKVVGSGRSDFANQINNVLAFPGVFRGALDAKATQITQQMKLSAAQAIASLVGDDELNENYVIPSPFDKRVAPAVAKAVFDMATKQGVVR